jgi:acyl-CoA synthetase (AMP-forming)/AMP-acid ligase II
MGLAAALGSLVAGVPWVHRMRFDAHAILDLIEARRPNVFIGVPTMYADLEAAGAENRDLSSIQLWVSAADAMPTDRARRFQNRGASIIIRGRPVGRAAFVDTYGMVELSGAAAIRVIPPISVNLPVPYRLRPGLQVRAANSEGQRLRLGTQGELQFRGAGVMLGYRGRDAGLKDGWLSTGDHGRVLPGGLFTLSGRNRDRLKVGGFSVFPAEVETVLDTYPSVREVAVVGVPDPRLGESLVALVVASEGFDEAAFLDWAAANLSGYRRPRSVIRVDGLPRGRNDKLDRDAATELALFE